jgi:hypothetical protein
MSTDLAPAFPIHLSFSKLIRGNTQVRHVFVRDEDGLVGGVLEHGLCERCVWCEQAKLSLILAEAATKAAAVRSLRGKKRVEAWAEVATWVSAAHKFGFYNPDDSTIEEVTLYVIECPPTAAVVAEVVAKLNTLVRCAEWAEAVRETLSRTRP